MDHLAFITEHALYQQVENQLSQMLANCKPATLVVAVSGGADSMALALLTSVWCEAYGWKCQAVTVDHQLRQESEQESRQVQKWLSAYGISHTTLVWEGQKPDSNIQANARDARYQLLSTFCKQQGHAYLLLAHHCDDQAETVLMRTLRGSGLQGLQGMIPVSDRGGITLLRPLLGVQKSKLIALLQGVGQPWVEDPSNEKEEYDRVWLRKLMATHRDANALTERLGRTAQQLQSTWDYVSCQIQKEWDAHVHVTEMGYVSFSREWFVQSHLEVQYQCLSEAIKLVGGGAHSPRSEQVLNILATLTDGEVTRRTVHGCLVSVRAAEVFISKEPNALPDAVEVTHPDVVWDRWAFQFSPRFVQSHQGAKIRALGEEGVKYIKDNAPELVKKNLPMAILYTIPSIWNLEKLVAAPHIGYNAGMEKEDLQYYFTSKCRFCL